MMKLKNLYLFLILLAVLSSCEEEITEPTIETDSSVKINSPRGSWNPNLPEALYFDSNDIVFFQGDNVTGWQNKLSPYPQHVNVPYSSIFMVNECLPNIGGWKLLLLKDGQPVRWLCSEEVSWNKDNPYSYLLFDWEIPLDQPSGANYQLELWFIDMYYQIAEIFGSRSREFNIGITCHIEPISPTSIDTSAKQNEYLRFTINTYSNNPNRILTARTVRNGVVIDQDTYDLSLFGNSAQLGLSRSFFLNTSSYPVGSDYTLILELDCGNNDVTTYQSTFSVEPGDNGGVIDPFLDPGF